MRIKSFDFVACLLLLALHTACSTSLPAVTPTPLVSPTHTQYPTRAITPPPLDFQLIQIPAPSLEGSLLDEPTEQPAQIYLPPSYNHSERRYPVVYFLPGFGSSTEGEEEYFPAAQLAAWMANDQLKEMILVVPNGGNLLHGSFYVNSSVTGNWEDFIVKDVVGFIDSNYRTLAIAGGRGIGGFSMGGFGAINLAMRFPDTFSAAYLLSAGLFDENGLADSQMFNTVNKITAFLDVMAELKAMPKQEAIRKMGKYDGALGLTMAYGAAFAPKPQQDAPFFDYPYEQKGADLERIPQVWKRWENGLGGWKQKVKQYHDHLSSLRGILIDYAKYDGNTWIPRGSEFLAKQLAATGVPFKLYNYPGDHGDRLEERLLTVMLPFFDQVLEDPH